MTSDDIGERVATLEAQVQPLLGLPVAVAEVRGIVATVNVKVDQILTNGSGRRGMGIWQTAITIISSALVALLVVILTHALAK